MALTSIGFVLIVALLIDYSNIWFYVVYNSRNRILIVNYFWSPMKSVIFVSINVASN